MPSRRFPVGRASSRRRLDKFLAAACGDLSRSRIQKLIEDGAVSVDASVEFRSSRTTEEGQTIEVRLPDEPAKTPLEAEEIPLDVLLEDPDLLVINKPPGLVVHPAPGHPSGTLVNAILHHCGSGLPGISGEQRPGIVHRLDRDTSGVLIIAKTDRAHDSLSRQMKKRSIRKEYVALAAGRPKLRKGEIALAIGRDPKDRKKMRGFKLPAPPSIREARTMYAIEKEWPALGLSLLRLQLITGRTHQIRVHLASIGCPVVGDPVYGKPRYPHVKDSDLKKALLAFPRQALHAERITFHHPATQQLVTVEAPWPEDLRRLVERVSS